MSYLADITKASFVILPPILALIVIIKWRKDMIVNNIMIVVFCGATMMIARGMLKDYALTHFILLPLYASAFLFDLGTAALFFACLLIFAFLFGWGNIQPFEIIPSIIGIVFFTMVALHSFKYAPLIYNMGIWKGD